MKPDDDFDPGLGAAGTAPPPPKGAGSAADAPKGSMSRVVGVGMSWMLATTAIAKGGALIQQVFLGYLLLEEDFGLWAASASAAAMFTWLRDAGVRELVIQRGEKEYHRLEGSVFWLAMTMNLFAGFMIAVITPALSTIVQHASAWMALILPGMFPAEGFVLPPQWSDRRLYFLMLAWAFWLPTQTFSSLLVARLNMLLRFGDSARINLFSSLLRSVLTVALAYAGIGPLAFVIPMITSAIFEAVYAHLLLRDKMWARPVDPTIWPGVLGSTKWLMVGVLGTNLFEWGGILAAGFKVNDAVLGLYAFARQIPLQIFIVMGSNFRAVLFPTLSILKDDPERLRIGALKAARVQMLLTAPLCLGTALICEPLVSAVWRNGRWDQAALPAAILCVFFAFRVTFGLTTSVLNAAGRFRLWAVLTILEGAGLGTAALIGANLKASATTIAVAVGLYFLVSRMIMMLITARVVKLRMMLIILAVMPPWGWSLVVAAATLFLCKPVTDRTGAWIDIVTLSVVFTFLFIYGTRLLMPVRLNEFVHILPGRIQRPFRALIRLPDFEEQKPVG